MINQQLKINPQMKFLQSLLLFLPSLSSTHNKYQEMHEIHILHFQHKSQKQDKNCNKPRQKNQEKQSTKKSNTPKTYCEKIDCIFVCQLIQVDLFKTNNYLIKFQLILSSQNLLHSVQYQKSNITPQESIINPNIYNNNYKNTHDEYPHNFCLKNIYKLNYIISLKSGLIGLKEVFQLQPAISIQLLSMKSISWTKFKYCQHCEQIDTKQG
eukprot:TRINITY_DN5527_c1_g1_i3.p1 TRINITY_DN5527_c1_g1~~TRINITY_DN5527_c1_g1_i3.p1  ORF type:complete len:211 (+),score=-19.70 TRINITY_DN5527_c1_g1_i3:104-736(+)